MSKHDGTYGGTTIYRPHERAAGHPPPETDEWKEIRGQERTAQRKRIEAQRKARGVEPRPKRRSRPPGESG